MKFKALVNNLAAENNSLEAATMILRWKERWLIGRTVTNIWYTLQGYSILAN